MFFEQFGTRQQIFEVVHQPISRTNGASCSFWTYTSVQFAAQYKPIIARLQLLGLGTALPVCGFLVWIKEENWIFYSADGKGFKEISFSKIAL